MNCVGLWITPCTKSAFFLGTGELLPFTKAIYYRWSRGRAVLVVVGCVLVAAWNHTSWLGFILAVLGAAGAAFKPLTQDVEEYTIKHEAAGTVPLWMAVAVHRWVQYRVVVVVGMVVVVMGMVYGSWKWS